MTNVAIFVSGGGTNCENIIRYFKNSEEVKIRLVVSNKADAYALVRAQNQGVPTTVITKQDFNDRQTMMSLLPDFLIEAYDRRMINIHPALLPKYGGKGMYGHHVHEAIKAAGETETGMTVHYVSNVCDGGEIIAQFRTPLSPDDTPDDIAHKEHLLEMEHFPKVIEEIIDSLQK